MSGPNDNQAGGSKWCWWPQRSSKGKAMCSLLMAMAVICSFFIIAVLYQVQVQVQAAAAAAATATTTSTMDTEPMETGIKTPVPVIGILTEVLRDYRRFTRERHLHIAASYVKWIESAGGQVAPVLLNQDDDYYERIFQQTNGLLFPGGDNLLDPAKRTPMMVAANKLYRLAVEANDRGDYYPIWGTCLGLELLSVLSGQRNVLDSCKANDIALPMEFVDRGALFAPSKYSNLNGLSQDYAKVIMQTLENENITYNYHQKCLTDAGLQRAQLADFYRPLAYSDDKNGFRFIAIMEAKRYPFFGVQFHPEKPPFEFVLKKSQMNIPHSRESIAVSRYFGDFFIMQAQRNEHRAAATVSPLDLIYNYDPMYTAPKMDMYEQRYLFGWNGSRAEALGLSTEEFVDDHIVESDEEVSEEVSQAGKRLTTSSMLLELNGDDNNDDDGDDNDVFRRIDLKVIDDRVGDDRDDVYLILESDETS